MLFPPGGPARGGIRYLERARPLAPLRQLVRAQLDDPVFTVTAVGPLERFATVEGEHAALVTVSGLLDGRPAQRDLGFVLLDDCYARAGGLCLVPDEFARFTELVRTLVRGDVHLAGERRRWFEY